MGKELDEVRAEHEPNNTSTKEISVKDTFTRHHGPSVEITMALLVNDRHFEIYMYHWAPNVGWGLYGKQVFDSYKDLVIYLMTN